MTEQLGDNDDAGHELPVTLEVADLARIAPIARESLRADLFAHLDPAVAEPLVDLQWRARSDGWRTASGDLQTRVIALGARDVGYLALALDPAVPEHRLLDLALVPDVRGQGLGRAVLSRILSEADDASSTVVLHVDPHNAPAVHLYTSLGFRQTASTETHLRMQRLPAHH